MDKNSEISKMNPLKTKKWEAQDATVCVDVEEDRQVPWRKHTGEQGDAGEQSQCCRI